MIGPRNLLTLVLLGALVWSLRRLFSSGSRASSAPPAAGPSRGGVAPDAADTLVRDRICNTCLPRRRALLLTVGGREHFFCSERCRQAFLQRESPA